MEPETNGDQDSLVRALAAAHLKLIQAEQHDIVQSTVITRFRLAHARAIYLQLAEVVSRRGQ